jgi:UDPglucose--hexose-1-phosphate uridylyltransferase
MKTAKSEFRRDLVSGDWILIAPVRGRRPHQFQERGRIKRASKKNCPFENPAAGGSEIILSWPNKNKNWQLQVIPNKYPVVNHNDQAVRFSQKGPFTIVPGIGHHEILITRDHDKNFSRLSPQNAFLVFRLLQQRYHYFLQDKETAYVSFFHNWGPRAGASIYHPHYQIITIPVIPPDVTHSLRGSEKFFKKNKICVHCLQIRWEKQRKKRIIFENRRAIAFIPFVSRAPFEIRIFPKKHSSFFEDSPETELRSFIEALQKSLQKLEKALKRPDYNFFLHTSPVKNKKKYHHYHWHLEIIPRTNIAAGFELGTAIEINPLDPDDAAAFINRVSKE